MSGSRGSGFTVIEVMLFLAISGFLVVGIMAGAGAAVNVQRYKDASNSFLSFVQGQYDKVGNVQNDHDLKQKCTDTGFEVSLNDVTRGSSLHCFVIGRLLTVSDGGKKITARAVYTNTDIRPGDGADALVSANIFVDPGTDVADIYIPDWSTRIVLPTALGGAAMDDWRLLIVRSPATGTIRTFTTTDSSFTSLQSIVAASVTRADVVACVDRSGLTSAASSGIRIVKDASGTSGVKMINPGEC